MPKLDNQTILLALTVVIGLAVLLQTIILLAIFVSIRKAAGSIRLEVEKLRASLMPVIYDTRDTLASTRDTLAKTQEFLANAQGFLIRVSPRIEATASDLAEITHGLRTQTAQMQSSAMEILERVRKQSDRVDHMITSLLDTVDRAGGFVANVVSRPVRQISSILGIVKAVVESLRTPPTLRRPAPPAGEDRFV
ncbi:MAG: hypothetical protein WCA89_07835 [Terracidiphilus sp.]|jgi:methyl-accepting chemotaxis protein